MIFASGMPSSTLLLKIVPIAKMVCDTPSIAKARAATMPRYREHDEASAEVRDEQPRVHRRQGAEIDHEPEEEGRDGDAEREARQRVGHAFGQRPQRDST